MILAAGVINGACSASKLIVQQLPYSLQDDVCRSNRPATGSVRTKARHCSALGGKAMYREQSCHCLLLIKQLLVELCIVKGKANRLLTCQTLHVANPSVLLPVACSARHVAMLLQVWELYRFRNGQDRALNIDFAYGGRLLSQLFVSAAP